MAINFLCLATRISIFVREYRKFILIGPTARALLQVTVVRNGRGGGEQSFRTQFFEMAVEALMYVPLAVPDPTLE